LTIIPQDAVLMEGTLRYNIDPLGKCSDQEIMKVLNEIGSSLLEDNDKGLDMMICENGANLSSGERQLVNIIRAIIRKTKIVILDEATANIDLITEQTIQKSITTYFKDSTVITIAHRIQTIINYDKILFLAQGSVLEYDSPQKLLSDKNSEFSKLCAKSI